MATRRPLILITGGSGFIGSQTVHNFLEHGYRVRLAGRNDSTCQKFLSTHKDHKNQIETIVVPDITVPHAFDSAVVGVDGIVHMASPFTHNVEDVERDLIVPAVNGTLEILKSTHQFAAQVKRVVITSSFAAINDFSKGLRPGHIYDESQWNPITHQQAKDNRQLAYAGSKTLAERAAWDFISTTPYINFTLSTINPVMVYGPPLPGSLRIDHLGQSTSEIYSLMNATLESVPPTPMPVFVDSRDVAEAHRLAFETEQSGRFAMCSGSFTKEGVCRLFRDFGLGLKDRVPKNGVDGDTVGEHYGVDNRRAREVLGIEFRGMEETFLDMARELLGMEGGGKGLKV